MYSNYGISSSKQNFRNGINSDPKNFRNTVQISNEINPQGKIPIELRFTKNDAIFVRKVYIHKSNLDKTIKKICQKGFYLHDNIENISNFSEIKVNPHYEYLDSQIIDFNRHGYNNSFKQKYLNNKHQ
jgi:hypothetical protein